MTNATETKRIEVGTIVVYKWGYEQTNVEFFQCVKRTATFAWFRKVKTVQESYDSQTMTGTAVPAVFGVNSYEYDERPEYAKPIRRKVKVWYDASNEFVDFNYGCASIWSGEAQSFSAYA